MHRSLGYAKIPEVQIKFSFLNFFYSGFAKLPTEFLASTRQPTFFCTGN